MNAAAPVIQIRDLAVTFESRDAVVHAVNGIDFELVRGETLCILGGSGGLELMLSACSVRDGVLHPTINYETPDPDCDLDYVPNESREMTIDHALSNSLGFGGHNVSILFARYTG